MFFHDLTQVLRSNIITYNRTHLKYYLELETKIQDNKISLAIFAYSIEAEVLETIRLAEAVETTTLMFKLTDDDTNKIIRDYYDFLKKLSRNGD